MLILTAWPMQNEVLCDTTNCMLVNSYRRFERVYLLYIVDPTLSSRFTQSNKADSFSETLVIQCKPLIMITLGPALFDNNNQLITLSGRYKNLHYLTQFVITTFTFIKNNIYLKNLRSVACCLFAFSSS
jgi:hypothetical protein